MQRFRNGTAGSPPRLCGGFSGSCRHAGGPHAANRPLAAGPDSANRRLIAGPEPADRRQSDGSMSPDRRRAFDLAPANSRIRAARQPAILRRPFEPESETTRIGSASPDGTTLPRRNSITGEFGGKPRARRAALGGFQPSETWKAKRGRQNKGAKGRSANAGEKAPPARLQKTRAAEQGGCGHAGAGRVPPRGRRREHGAKWNPTPGGADGRPGRRSRAPPPRRQVRPPSGQGEAPLRQPARPSASRASPACAA